MEWDEGQERWDGRDDPWGSKIWQVSELTKLKVFYDELRDVLTPGNTTQYMPTTTNWFFCLIYNPIQRWRTYKSPKIKLIILFLTLDDCQNILHSKASEANFYRLDRRHEILSMPRNYE